MSKAIGVWFLAVRAGTGTDIFVERMVTALNQRGIKAVVDWLPHRAEYLPWSVPVPTPPDWATIMHINTWLHTRFIPKNIPIVATFHWAVNEQLLDKYRSITQKIYHNLWISHCEKRAVSKANKLTAVSRYSATQAENRYKSIQVTPIHNWIDHEVFKPGRASGSGRRLLFVGKPSIAKGADLLPKIMNLLGGAYELVYTALPEELPGYPRLPSNMVGIGRIIGDNNLASFYNSGDILLLPSRSEGFGLVALEAQSCGIPVVASNVSSLPEIVLDGVTGFLCPCNHATAFADAVEKISNNSSLREKMSQAAREHALKFSEDRQLAEYIKIYTTLGARHANSI
ncbi:glycosyltransferase family 4 protein [Cellvibrio sp. ARAG 10.3]|uniref:glycosyltransferase family 4 protein n=1 Tax=Cellvibrio sp. ARAG 10.3 TaxID=3451358 RepID=UPI003F45F8E0